jgi:hypothetical protein
MPVLVKKILTWGVVIFLIFFMAFRPEAAADMFRSVGAVLMALTQGLGDFFSRLFV